MTTNNLAHHHREDGPVSLAEFNQVLCERDFIQRMQEERLRAEAGKISSSLIALRFENGNHRFNGNVAITSRIVSSLAGNGAEFGNLRDGRLGVLLQKPPAEVSCLAVDLSRELVRASPHMEFDVYHFSSFPVFDASGSLKRAATVAGDQEIDEVLVAPMPAWKRSFDIIASLIGLLVFSPLFALAAIGIKFLPQGPVFYFQQRSGVGGKPFWIYKFRTMVVNADEQRMELKELNEQDGPAFKIEEDPRITVVGHWLRRLFIDELPQLLNVLKGDMSLVGPRPLPCHEADECEQWQRRRLAVVPGMTCYWQVADRSKPIPFDDWMRMDLKYIRNRSFATDMGLLFKTLLFVIGFRGR
jgi:lipopolysaccharide/colanic/teichoic acid biosynthesis glycosyltransferase